MNSKVLQNLKNEYGNYILPFFWQRGESEEKLREYVNAINGANIREMCLEARPHPDFAGEQWFHDVDVILDEAKKLDMKIWILDDAHFPSGQAANKFAAYPDRLHKIFMNYNMVDVCGPVKQVTVNVEQMAHYYVNPFAGGGHPFLAGGPQREWTDPEKLMAVVAGKLDGKYGDMNHLEELIDITEYVKDGVLTWDVPTGNYRIFVIYQTQKGGGRLESVNFLSKESCRAQIDCCYEPHKARYGEEFGKTILGFFSDEPEIGNIAGYDAAMAKIGTPSMPLPWSEEVPAMMEERFGKDYITKLVSLWYNVGTDEFTADMRVGFMDIVTTLCKQNFADQLGDWCRENNLLYIGHVVEDNNASTGCGCSQGHFFRALWGQDWSGIDNIGGQVTLGGANSGHRGFLGIIDGEFFHQELGKMGTSLADIDPKKKGNTMCEIFGAYGWDEGTRLMKYEADHFLVRGVNRYVPHAFSAQPFPDHDCPPHFYAHGKNPLYKPFGTLMTYMNRVSHMISDGFHEVNVAVMYHAESEWSGMAFTAQGKIGRFLNEAQIDFDFIPADVFRYPEMFDSFYDEEGLHINGHVFTSLVLPGLQYITPETRAFIEKAMADDFLVLFADRVPDGMEDVVPTRLEDLAAKLTLASQTDALISPECKDIQVYHYSHETEEYYLINNESAGDNYKGELFLPVDTTDVYYYDAFKNELRKANAEAVPGGIKIKIKLHTYKMAIIVIPKTDEINAEFAKVAGEARICGCSKESTVVTGDWKVSFCSNEAYPAFADEISMSELKGINFLKPTWSGIAQYTNTVQLTADATRLRIEDAYESVEVWVNDQYAGERICPPYCFDITGLAKDGVNELRIECRTTLEREAFGITHGMGPFGPQFAAVRPSGLIGEVKIH